MATSTSGVDRVLAPAKWNIEGVWWPYEYYRFDKYYVNDTHDGTSGFTGLNRTWSKLDFSYLGNLPAGNDFFELCDKHDPVSSVPMHCRSVRQRAKPFAYIALTVTTATSARMVTVAWAPSSS